MNQPISVSYTVADYVNASALHWRNAFFGFKLARLLLIVAVISAAIYGAIAEATDATPHEATLVAGGAALGGVVLLIVMSLISRALYLPYVVRRNFQQLKEYHTPWTVTVTDEKVLIHNSRGDAQLPYGDFVKWSENDKTFLLYRSERLFNLIPRHSLPPEVHSALISRLEAAAVPKASFRNS